MKNTSMIHLMIALSLSSVNAEDEPKPQVKSVETIYPKHIYGDLQKSSKAPDGMITVIREKGSWKFKILSSEIGWNNMGSRINRAILRGDGYRIPIKLSDAATISDLNRVYTYIVLSDEMIKSASLELHSASFGRGGNKSILYTLKLSELVK